MHTLYHIITFKIRTALIFLYYKICLPNQVLAFVRVKNSCCNLQRIEEPACGALFHIIVCYQLRSWKSQTCTVARVSMKWPVDMKQPISTVNYVNRTGYHM